MSLHFFAGGPWSIDFFLGAETDILDFRQFFAGLNILLSRFLIGPIAYYFVFDAFDHDSSLFLFFRVFFLTSECCGIAGD